MKVDQYEYVDDNKVSLKLTVYKDGDWMLNRSDVGARRKICYIRELLTIWVRRLKVIISWQDRTI